MPSNINQGLQKEMGNRADMDSPLLNKGSPPRKEERPGQSRSLIVAVNLFVFLLLAISFFVFLVLVVPAILLFLFVVARIIRKLVSGQIRSFPSLKLPIRFHRSACKGICRTGFASDGRWCINALRKHFRQMAG